jgi:hypothetical protein
MADTSFLSVIGRSNMVYKNDLEAAFIEDGNHLILWNEDSDRNMWIDKYDVRFHLTNYSDIEYNQPTQLLTPGDVIDSIDIAARKIDKELDHERYIDLAKNPVINSYCLVEEENSDGSGTESTCSNLDCTPNNNDASGPTAPDYRFSHTYKNTSENCITSDTTVHHVVTNYNTDLYAAELISIPFTVPEGITVPRTKKQLDIIMHTALKTRKSIQLEIFLKVKQCDNRLFEFLNIGSSCHDFYMVIMWSTIYNI